MKIIAYNISVENSEISYISAPVTAGVSTVQVQSSVNFDGNPGNSRILIGKMGTERAEIRTWSSVPNNTSIAFTTALSFDHAVDEPLYELQFDQVRFWRSTTGVDGSYSLLATVDMDVNNPDGVTVYDDTTSAAGYYYKIEYRHSVTTDLSELSDPIPATGFTYKSVGRIIKDFYAEYPNASDQATPEVLISWMNAVNDDLETRTTKPYTCLHTREAFGRTADSYTLDFPEFSDGSPKMWKFDFLEYNYQDSSTTPVTDITYPVRILPLEEYEYKYQDNTISSTTVDDRLQVATLDTALNKIKYYPPSETSGNAVFYLYYWKYFTRFNSEADEVETPNPKLYEDYIRARYYRLLAKKEDSYLSLSDRFMSDYNLEVSKLPRSNRKDAGSPRSLGYTGGSTYKGYRQY